MPQLGLRPLLRPEPRFSAPVAGFKVRFSARNGREETETWEARARRGREREEYHNRRNGRELHSPFSEIFGSAPAVEFTVAVDV